MLDDTKLTEASYKGFLKSVITHNDKDLSSDKRIFQYGFNSWSTYGHNTLSFLGQIATITYSILTWNVFKKIANANLIRAGASYLLAIFFSILFFILFTPFLMSVGENRFSAMIH